jgi:hypothetical protein
MIPLLFGLVSFKPGESVALKLATELLLASAGKPEVRLTPAATRLALAKAGVSANTSLLLALRPATAPPPFELIPSATTAEAMSYRDFASGVRLYVLAWTTSTTTLSPLPMEISSHQPVPFTVSRSGRLLVATPNSVVEETSLQAGRTRILSGWDTPGEYRVEFVVGDQVELLFSVFVGMEAPEVPWLLGPVPLPEPAANQQQLYAKLADLRRKARLPALSPWSELEPTLQDHARCLAQIHQLAHQSPSCPGVASLMAERFYPRPRLYENLVAAQTAEEAWDSLMASPGHLKNMLCTECSAVAIGSVEAAERLISVMELADFQAGEPQSIHR